jgi:transposase
MRGQFRQEGERMSRKPRLVFTQEFKLSAVLRMVAGENVAALSRELGVLRKSLYVWRDRHRVGGVEALRARRPGPKRGPMRELPDGAALSALADALATPATRVAGENSPVDGDALLRQRIAGLEQKIGQQALDLDFFHKALRHFKGALQPSAEPGVAASTRSSER